MDAKQLNQMGLVVSETGQIVGIDLPISDNGLFATGYSRRVRLKRLTFDADLEMLVVFERYMVDEGGHDVYALIQEDITLAATAKRERLLCLQPIETAKTTRGSFRSSKTGAVCADGEEGAVPELLFFQNLALTQLKAQGLPLTGKEPYIIVVYLMLANIVREIDARGEL